MPFFTRRSSNFRGDPLCREIAPSCKRIMLSHQILFSMQSNSCRRVTVLCWFFFFSSNCGSRNLFPSIVEVFFPEKYVLQSYHYVLVWIPLSTSENLWLKSRACHQTISNLKPFLIEGRLLCSTRDFGQIKTAFVTTAWWNKRLNDQKNLALFISYPSITSRFSGNEPAPIEEETQGNVGN